MASTAAVEFYSSTSSTFYSTLHPPSATTLLRRRRRPSYATHWAQRISAAIVFGDAQRALAQVDKLKRQLTTSTSTCSHHNPPGGQQATFASPDARDRRKRCHRVGARGRH